MYICPGCGHTSKRGLGTTCKKCNYDIPDFRFPSVEEILNKKEELKGKWDDVNLIEYTISIVDYLVKCKQLELKIVFNEPTGV